MNARACALSGPNDERIVLCDVSVQARLRDLLAEVEIAQTYRNDEPVNIEATYTFPLPVDAVLLGLTLIVGERVLSGVVVEKHEAEDTYEDAVEAGDTAILLQAIEPGLYTLNLGHLMPGERATIRFRYTMLHRWTGDSLRFHLPTTIAPRYGESPHLPHQAPEASLSVENTFTLQVTLEDRLAPARLECPTHPVTLTHEDGRARMTLQQARAAMDRDFVLNIQAPTADRNCMAVGADGEGFAAIASFQPFFPGLRTARPLKVAVLIDCSGSMAGDSIAQARDAVSRILDSLRATDQATLIAFGSTTQALSDRLLACDARMLASARTFADALDANLGGTEIGEALQAAYRALAGHGLGEVFVVTDGEVSDWQPTVAQAQESGHRVFTVGVGSAVSEAFIRELADDTGGECELVTPGEAMPERIARHFERMRAPRARRAWVQWPEGAVDCCPQVLGSVFEGDSVVASARIDQRPHLADVSLEIETDDGQRQSHRVLLSVAAEPPGEAPSAVARLAATMRLRTQDAEDATAAALRYQLISEYTHMLAVLERSDQARATRLPEFRKVSHTQSAGHAGAGCVSVNYSFMDHYPSEVPVPIVCLRTPAMTVKKGAVAKAASDSTARRGFFDFLPMIRRIRRNRSRNAALPPSVNCMLKAIEHDPTVLQRDSIQVLFHLCGVEAESGIELSILTHFPECEDDSLFQIVLGTLLGGPLRDWIDDSAIGAVNSLLIKADRALSDLEGSRAAASVPLPIAASPHYGTQAAAKRLAQRRTTALEAAEAAAGDLASWIGTYSATAHRTPCP